MEQLVIQGGITIIQKGANLVRKGFRHFTSKHCRHCRGDDAECSCTKGCKTKKKTQCSAVWAHCFHCRGLPGTDCTCTCQPPCRAETKVHCNHFFSCDNCQIQRITGSIFVCRHCHDWGLCEDCYNRGIHKHHSFYRVEWPGASRVSIPARDPGAVPDIPTKPPPQPPQPAVGASQNFANYGEVAVDGNFNYLGNFNDTYNAIMQQQGLLHPVKCDQCQTNPISGIRYECHECPSFNLCSTCYWIMCYGHRHSFLVHENAHTQPTLMPGW